MKLEISERKGQIYKTAEKLFRKSGFHGTSMRDIACELDLEAASLYSHIKSKDEILEFICFRMAGEFLTAMDEVNDIYFNAEEKIRMAIKLHVEILTNDIDATGVFIHEWRHLKEPYLSDFKNLRDKYENAYKIIIQQGIDEHVFEPVDNKFAVLTILSTLNWITEWYRPDGGMTADEIAVKLSEFILTGLKKKYI